VGRIRIGAQTALVGAFDRSMPELNWDHAHPTPPA
jgi:hypothetical protein